MASARPKPLPFAPSPGFLSPGFDSSGFLSPDFLMEPFRPGLSSGLPPAAFTSCASTSGDSFDASSWMITVFWLSSPFFFWPWPLGSARTTPPSSATTTTARNDSRRMFFIIDYLCRGHNVFAGAPRGCAPAGLRSARRPILLDQRDDLGMVLILRQVRRLVLSVTELLLAGPGPIDVHLAGPGVLERLQQRLHGQDVALFGGVDQGGPGVRRRVGRCPAGEQPLDGLDRELRRLSWPLMYFSSASSVGLSP